jgi:hypothetical protein
MTWHVGALRIERAHGSMIAAGSKCKYRRKFTLREAARHHHTTKELPVIGAEATHSEVKVAAWLDELEL